MKHKKRTWVNRKKFLDKLRKRFLKERADEGRRRMTEWTRG